MCDVCGAIGSFELNSDADSIEQKALDAYWNACGPIEEIAAIDHMIELGMMRDRSDIAGMAKTVSTLNNRRIR
jgi:hypothetical protein